jgi:hypothetical protein
MQQHRGEKCNGTRNTRSVFPSNTRSVALDVGESVRPWAYSPSASGWGSRAARNSHAPDYWIGSHVVHKWRPWPAR